MSEVCSLMKNVSMQSSMAWMPATKSSAQCAESKKALSTAMRSSTLQQFGFGNRQNSRQTKAVDFNKMEEECCEDAHCVSFLGTI